MGAYKEEIVISKHISFGVWAKLFRYVYKYWYLIILLFVTMILTSFYDSSFIPSLNYGFMHAFDSPTQVDIWLMPITFKLMYFDVTMNFAGVIGLYFGFIVMRSVSIFISFYILNFFEMHIMTSLRKDAFKKIQELSFSYFDRTSSGWLIARLQNDASSIGEVMSYSILRVFWILFDLIFTLVTMFSYSWQFSLIILATTPLIGVIVMIFNRLILKYHRIARNSYSYFVGWLAECISGTKTIKSLAIEDTIYEECKKTTSDVQTKRHKAIFVGSLFNPSIQLLSSINTALLIVLFVVFSKYFPGNPLFSDVFILVIFISFVGQIYSPIQQFAEVFSDLMATQASVEKLYSLLEAKPELKDTKQVIEQYGDLFNNKKENFEPMKGDIKFNHVSFSYQNGIEVIHDINLHIKQGTSCAIVGETGSGKSTTVNLLCRFYEPSKGNILIDDKDYKSRSVGWIRSNIGYVQQTPFIFKGTVKDNIRYGKLDATDEEIIAACKVVDIHEFILSLKDGYDTYLDGGGGELSQGQKQLLSFARAIIRDPHLLILDEATSSIDTETESIVQKALNKTLKGRTSVIIAHRLSTIVDCDRIVVMKDGNIIEDGSHSELMALKGCYFNLYMNQFKELDLGNQIDIYQSQIQNKGIKI